MEGWEGMEPPQGPGALCSFQKRSQEQSWACKIEKSFDYKLLDTPALAHVYGLLQWVPSIRIPNAIYIKGHPGIKSAGYNKRQA